MMSAACTPVPNLLTMAVRTGCLYRLGPCAPPCIQTTGMRQEVKTAPCTNSAKQNAVRTVTARQNLRLSPYIQTTGMRQQSGLLCLSPKCNTARQALCLSPCKQTTRISAKQSAVQTCHGIRLLRCGSTFPRRRCHRNPCRASKWCGFH